jgi:hypothetical protein
MPATRAATDAAMSGLSWVVGESYKVHDAVDRLSVGRWSGLPGYYNPKDHGRDSSGQWVGLRPYNYKLQPTEFWVRLIEDASPHPRTRTPRVWSPSEHKGLADELVALGSGDEAAIVAWVRANGFVGLRANPRERSESVEEIQAALTSLGRTRAIVRAVRELKGKELRAEVERQMIWPAGYLAEMQKDGDRQTISGPNLARRFGIEVPDGAKWEGAGAYIQALYSLTDALNDHLSRFLRVQADVAPTQDGMRLQGSIVAIGPLATAFLQTLDEASWPAITYTGSLPRIDWRAPRRCGRCGTTFRPSRRDQRWCGQRCRWAASIAARRSARQAGGSVGSKMPERRTP